MPDLIIGDPCPAFDLPADGNRSFSNTDIAGMIAVLFFYPRDNTSGCTREAVEFTRANADFDHIGTTVFGVSKDSLKSHDKFVAKHELGIPILSDETSDLCERVGCWKEKTMYGKTYWGIERTTILVDSTGIVRKIWRKVKVPGHVDDVLQSARDL